VTVVENPVIGRRGLRGNKKVKGRAAFGGNPVQAAGTLSRPMVQSDAQRIAEIYRRSGRYDVRVNPEIIEQPNNRVDLIFTITRAPKPAFKSIEFIRQCCRFLIPAAGRHQDGESNLLSFPRRPPTPTIPTGSRRTAT